MQAVVFRTKTETIIFLLQVDDGYCLTAVHFCIAELLYCWSVNQW